MQVFKALLMNIVKAAILSEFRQQEFILRLSFYKSGDRWSVIANVDGTATDVNSVDFCDFNNDGKMEIIVCWSVVSKQTGTSINVYSQNENDNKYSLKSLRKTSMLGSQIY